MTLLGIIFAFIAGFYLKAYLDYLYPPSRASDQLSLQASEALKQFNVEKPKPSDRLEVLDKPETGQGVIARFHGTSLKSNIDLGYEEDEPYEEVVVSQVSETSKEMGRDKLQGHRPQMTPEEIASWENMIK